MIIVGSHKMVVYDDIADDTISIYYKGIDRKAILGENMDLTSHSPRNSTIAAGICFCRRSSLTNRFGPRRKHYLDCIRNQRVPLTGVEHARNVVSILERAQAPVTPDRPD